MRLRLLAILVASVTCLVVSGCNLTEPTASQTPQEFCWKNHQLYCNTYDGPQMLESLDWVGFSGRVNLRETAGFCI